MIKVKKIVYLVNKSTKGDLDWYYSTGEETGNLCQEFFEDAYNTRRAMEVDKTFELNGSLAV